MELKHKAMSNGIHPIRNHYLLSFPFQKLTCNLCARQESQPDRVVLAGNHDFLLRPRTLSNNCALSRNRTCISSFGGKCPIH